MSKMHNKPLISIITVTYNSEKTIHKTIESVINQKYKNYEYIIKDGLSTDKTIDLIYSYENDIDCIISKEDCGIYDAMNYAIKETNGDWIIFLNADDHFYDDKVLNRFEKYI